MTLTLYRIPQLSVDKQNTLSFNSPSDRAGFFSNITQKITVSSGDSTLGRITDLGKLYQQVTVFTNGRNPYTSYNYAQISGEGQNVFYFITDFREVGNSQIIYSLKMDTLISYVTPASGAQVNVTTYKALVTREHKDRFNYTTNRVIPHRIPEAADNTTPYHLSTSSISGTRARLVYKKRTDSKPVAYPYVESPTTVSVAGADWIGTVYSSRETSSEPMYVWDGSFEYTYGVGTPNISVTVAPHHYIRYHRDATGLVRQLRLQNKSNGADVGAALTIPNNTDLRIKVGTTDIQELRIADSYINSGVSWSQIQSTTTIINFSPTSLKALPLWTEIDQYDAMTDRIVEVPYFTTTILNFYEDGYGIFIPLETSLTTAATVGISTPFVYDLSKVDKPHVVGNDPKLYNSQFAPVIINLNGASFGLKRELLSGPSGVPATVVTTLTFGTEVLTPSTFNGRMSISTYDYDIEDADELRQTWDVNNEIASIKDEAYTYNQYYKDLDDKQRNIQESAAKRNAVLNSINQGLGVTGGLIAGGAKVTPTQIAARSGQAAINIAQSFLDLQDQLKLNEIAAKQKYIGLLLSASQISGAPLKFIKTFDGDRWRINYYGLKDLDLAYWDEVFHRFGYTTLEYKVPTLKTRKYWDYKQMIIDEIASGYVTEECIADIKQRFADGVTIFHYQGLADPTSVDWGQTKENWEI